MENNRENSGNNFNNENNTNQNFGAGSSSSGMSNSGNLSGSNAAGSSFSNHSGSATGSSRMMTGMFRDRESAERAYNSLSTRGYSKDDVNLVMSDDTRKRHFGDDSADSDLGDKALEGAGAGSAIGGTLGAIVGAVAAIGTSVALPGLGLIIAGPLAAGLAGAGAGGLTGGLLGALVGSGIPEDRAKEYESGVKEGGIVMGVTPRNDEDATYLENEWRNSRGESIYR
jgi:hypothetical protein